MKKPPNIHIYPLEKEIKDESKFLELKRQYCELSYPNGSKSERFIYDYVKRVKKDASAIIAHTKFNGMRAIYLRSCVRPAIGLEYPEHGNQWEIAAGLIDPGETPLDAAVRETQEELGFFESADKFRPLGNFTFPTVGICPERIYFFEVEVDHHDKKEPTLDGSPLEKNGIVELVSLDEAFRLMLDGKIPDAKTEIAIWRLKNII